jgi:2,3-dihydroxybenzoate decarboxylase
MRYIALEEAFSIPELAGHQPPPWPAANVFSRRLLAEWARKLPDFTEYRLPEMDAAGIDVQVLSLTVPGLQADIDAATARDDARFANDYLARVVAEYPDRFHGFAALPMQEPKAAVDELDRSVRELGFCGALVNDHFQGHYLDEPRYDEVWAALEELSVPLYLHPGAPPADDWKVLDGHPLPRSPERSWSSAPTRSCSRSTTRMSPARKQSPGLSGPRSATPTGRRSRTVTPSAFCGSRKGTSND